MNSLSEEMQNALLAIHSRLGAIEGKVNLVARAERDALLQLVESVVRAKPLIGQIYLLLDGERNQKDVVAKLAEFGVKPNQSTVSRAMTAMETEHGIADLVQGGATKIYRKDVAMDKVLNLSANVRKWLGEEGEVVPADRARRQGRT